MEPPGDPQQASQGAPPAVRRFQLISSIAIVSAAVPYLWVLWDLWTNAANPLRTDGPGKLSDHVYDAQARAILHGHLSLPKGSIGVEAFIHGGRTYTYFGIFPSVIRIPILLVTNSLDGRLTALSILASWLVTALFSALLLWRIRTVVRGEAPLGWAETSSYGVLLFSILAGSVLVFLASEPNVYTEDLAWSVALACGSLFTLVGVLESPSWARVAMSGLLLLVTNLNRATTGYACILGTILIAVWFGLGRGGPDRRRWALPVLVAALVPLIAGCAIDLAKFHLLFGIRAAEQELYRAYGFSHVNGGQYFSIRFLPSTLQAYVTPGNIRVSEVFPYLRLPDNPTHPIAHTMLFTRAPTASVPASMPLLFGAGLWGVIVTFLPHRPAVVRSLRILLLATAATAGVVMIFGWVIERFVADFLPLLVLASMLGMVDIWRRLDGSRQTARILVPAILCVLALFGFVANMGIAITPIVGWTQTQASSYVQTERDFSDLTGHPLSHNVVRGSHFPTNGTNGQLFVLGNCRELYISDQAVPIGIYSSALVWLPVEREPHTDLCRSLIGSATTAPLETSISLPHRGQAVSGSDVLLLAYASAGGTVSSVSFMLAGGSPPALGTVGRGISFSYGWICKWDSRSVPNGTYILTSVATDTEGHRISSSGVRFTVRNPASGT